MNIFLDIETIPAHIDQESLVREQFNKRSSSQNTTSTRKPTTFEEFWHGTSLDPNFGQILCVGYAINNKPSQVIYGDSEKEILIEWWQVAKNATQLIGHNLSAFDIPFLWKRSVLNGVKPTVELKNEKLYFDTMLIWDLASPKKHTGLDLLAKLLKIPTSKGEVHGAVVYDYYRAGKLQKIYDYCKRDVEVTREVYKKLTFL